MSAVRKSDATVAASLVDDTLAEQISDGGQPSKVLRALRDDCDLKNVSAHLSTKRISKSSAKATMKQGDRSWTIELERKDRDWRVTSITEVKNVDERESYTPDVKYVDSKYLPEGQEAAKSDGVDGEQIVTYAVEAINGEQQGRKRLRANVVDAGTPEERWRGTGDQATDVEVSNVVTGDSYTSWGTVDVEKTEIPKSTDNFVVSFSLQNLTPSTKIKVVWLKPDGTIFDDVTTKPGEYTTSTTMCYRANAAQTKIVTGWWTACIYANGRPAALGSFKIY